MPIFTENENKLLQLLQSSYYFCLFFFLLVVWFLGAVWMQFLTKRWASWTNFIIEIQNNCQITDCLNITDATDAAYESLRPFTNVFLFDIFLTAISIYILLNANDFMDKRSYVQSVVLNQVTHSSLNLLVPSIK